MPTGRSSPRPSPSLPSTTQVLRRTLDRHENDQQSQFDLLVDPAEEHTEDLSHRYPLTTLHPLPAHAPSGGPWIILSLGMGIDSSAILTRFIKDPTSRTFPLSDLIILTLQLGSEWNHVLNLVETYLLPLLRTHQIRYIQASRLGPREEDGIAILDDSTHPERIQGQGAYRLADEMVEAGTIPQLGGIRKCSLKAKGWVGDQILSHLLGGHPFRHIIGYAAEEGPRITRDLQAQAHHRHQDTPLALREPWFPLAEDWGWNREDCRRYLYEVFNVEWARSACTFCPFTQGKEDALLAMQDEPEGTGEALYLEYIALSINPRQGLYGENKRLHDLLQSPEVRSRYKAAFLDRDLRLKATEWTVYRVRRIWDVRTDAQGKPSAPPANRSVESIQVPGSRPHPNGGWTLPTREDALEALLAIARTEGKTSTEHVLDIPRICIRNTTRAQRESPGLHVEEYITIAPAVVTPKTLPIFRTRWLRFLAQEANPTRSSPSDFSTASPQPEQSHQHAPAP